MSKINKHKSVKQEEKAPRSSVDITAEYTTLCAELGNSLIQFEVTKSKAFAAFQALNEEMLKANELEKAAADKVLLEVVQAVK